MNPARYTQAAEQAGERYINTLNVFRSLLFQAQTQPYTDANARALRSNALSVGRAFLTNELDYIEQEITDTAINAVTSAHTDMKLNPVYAIPNDLEPFLTQSEAFLKNEISAQLQRDAESLVKRYREFAVEANLLHRSTGRTLRSAIASTGNQASERIRFQFRDRGGRLYSSSKFIRTVWRQTLVSMGAEFYLLEASSRGATSIKIDHPDPQSQWHGYEIDLTDPASFLDIRDEAFHPNSNAVLKVVHV